MLPTAGFHLGAVVGKNLRPSGRICGMRALSSRRETKRRRDDSGVDEVAVVGRVEEEAEAASDGSFASAEGIPGEAEARSEVGGGGVVEEKTVADLIGGGSGGLVGIAQDGQLAVDFGATPPTVKYCTLRRRVRFWRPHKLITIRGVTLRERAALFPLRWATRQGLSKEPLGQV